MKIDECHVDFYHCKRIVEWLVVEWEYGKI